MKKIFGILGLALVLFVVFVVVAHDWVIKVAAEQSVTRLTGFKTTIQNLKYDFPSTMHIQGLKIENPKGFEAPVFADLPEIFVDLNADALMKGEKIHLRKVILNLAEVHVEKNLDGVTNVSLLTAAGGKGGAQQPAPAKTEPQKGMPFQIDELDLTMRQVSYEDRSGLGPTKLFPGGLKPDMVTPKKISLDMRIEHEKFNNITNPQAIVSIILMKIFYGTTFGRLMEINPQMLQDNLKGALVSGQKMLTDTAGAMTQEATAIAGQVTDKLLEGAGSVKDLAGDTVGKNLDSAASSAKAKIGGFMNKVSSTLPGDEKKSDSTATTATAKA